MSKLILAIFISLSLGCVSVNKINDVNKTSNNKQEEQTNRFEKAIKNMEKGIYSLYFSEGGILNEYVSSLGFTPKSLTSGFFIISNEFSVQNKISSGQDYSEIRERMNKYHHLSPHSRYKVMQKIVNKKGYENLIGELFNYPRGNHNISTYAKYFDKECVSVLTLDIVPYIMLGTSDIANGSSRNFLKKRHNSLGVLVADKFRVKLQNTLKGEKVFEDGDSIYGCKVRRSFYKERN